MRRTCASRSRRVRGAPQAPAINRCSSSLRFHRGVASIAVQAAAVLTPVYIRVDQPFLHKFQPWYRAPARPPQLDFVVGEDIDLEPYRIVPPPRASRELNAWLLSHYEAKLGQAAGYNPAR